MATGQTATMATAASAGATKLFRIRYESFFRSGFTASRSSRSDSDSCFFRQSVRAKDDGKHRNADPEVPVQVDHAASPSSFLARGNTVMAPTS